MKTVSGGRLAQVQAEVTQECRCWEITRTDGEVFRFTSLDDDVVFDGDTYLASSGFKTSAIAADSSLSVDNLEVSGFFNLDGVDEEALRAGLFDYAEIRVFDINWADPTTGALKLRRAWLGEVVQTSQGWFHAEVRGMTQLLQQDIVELYQPDCRADLGDSRCKIPIKPDLVERNHAYVTGDTVRAATTADVPLIQYLITNPGAETADGGSGATGWTSEQTKLLRSVVQNTTDITGVHRPTTAQAGTHVFAFALFLAGPATDAYAHQDIAIAASQIDACDAGNLEMTLTWYQISNASNDDHGEMTLIYLDEDGAQIGTEVSIGTSDPTAWTQRQIIDTAPVGARTFRLRMHGHQDQTGGQLITEMKVWFDTISFTGRDTVSTFQDYGDAYYECTTAGTTDSSVPSGGYDPTVDATTADGSAVFTARNAWLRGGAVGLVSDRKTFTVSLTEPRAVDGWFALGAITWITGDNTGRSQEVKHWTQLTNTVEVYLAPPYAVSVGDLFEIYPGCAKRRTEDCKHKFDNVINFRGEPDIPGLDALFNYPDAQ